MKESKSMMKKEVSFMKKKGAPRSMIKHEEAEMKGTKKMAGGGMAYAKGGMPDLTGDGKVTRADVLKGRGVFRKGGSVSSRADGIASKGKTKGKIVKMMMGGVCK